MHEYLFHLELPHGSQQIKEEAREQEEHINQLFIQGTMRSYSIDVNRTMVWCVIEAENEQEAMNVVAKFPIYPLCTDVVHYTLQVHHNQPYILPDISLN